MKWIATAAQIRQLESRWFHDYGLAQNSLMEVAGRGCAEWIMTHRAEALQQGVWVVCGPGNNGGDGYVIARTLHAQGVLVHAIQVGSPSATTEMQARICQRSGVPTHACFPAGKPPGVIVDALFGIGCTRKLEGVYLEAVTTVMAGPTDVVSIDMPSGICADTGSAHNGEHVRASATLTLEHAKPGLYLQAGPDSSGHVVVIPLHLGIPDLQQGFAQCWERSDVADNWPTRPRDAHKGHSGHLLVVAGSMGMAGAAALTVKGAFSVGVGRVTLLAPEDAHTRLQDLPPEAMLVPGWQGDLSSPPSLDGFSAVVAGPGLGSAPEGLANWLERIWRKASIPLLFDADALPYTTEGPHENRILTPHPGEAGRLLQRSVAEINGAREESASALSRRGVALLKGRYTLIADGSGRRAFNTTGAPTLATAGSGDVLSGIIGGLAARGVRPWEAACAGAWLHGEAGARMEAERAEGWLASDIAARISSCVPI